MEIFSLLTLIVIHQPWRSWRVGVSPSHCTHCPSSGVGGPLSISLSVFRRSNRSRPCLLWARFLLFFFRTVVLLFSIPPAQTFVYDALRRTIHHLKNPFSVRLLLDPLFPCVSVPSPIPCISWAGIISMRRLTKSYPFDNVGFDVGLIHSLANHTMPVKMIHEKFVN